MKRLIVIVLSLSVLCLPMEARRRWVPRVAASGPVLWISQTTDNDFWNSSQPSNYASQKIQVPSSKTVTKVRIKMNAAATTANVQIGFWSDALGTSTQYGTTSITTVVPTGSATYLDFTWTSNPTITTDCFLVIKTLDNGIVNRADTVAGGTGYIDTIFCYATNGVPDSSGTSDLVFEIYTL